MLIFGEKVQCSFSPLRLAITTNTQLLGIDKNTKIVGNPKDES